MELTREDLFFAPLLVFLWTSIYVARQPVDVHKYVAECLADPKCAAPR